MEKTVRLGKACIVLNVQLNWLVRTFGMDAQRSDEVRPLKMGCQYLLSYFHSALHARPNVVNILRSPVLDISFS